MKRKLLHFSSSALPTRAAHVTKLLLKLFLTACLYGGWGGAGAAAQGTDDFYGVMFSSNENVANAQPRLNELGVRWCRVWVGIQDWQIPANNSSNAFQQALDLHKAGYKVILEINSNGGVVPTYTQARDMYLWMLAKPGLKDAVDMWEIFNELNNTEYYAEAYSTTVSLDAQAQHYVNGALKAAWDVFHVGNAEQVLGGSWTLWQQRSSGSAAASYNLNVTRAYVNNGYLNYCDYAGIHPYHETPAGQVAAVTDAKLLFGTKPMVITEWGLKPQGYDVTTYTAAMNQNLAFIRDNAVTACYYRWSPGNGWFGLVTASTYTPIEPAYSTYKNWPKTAAPTFNGVYKLVARHSGKSLDVSGANTADGAAVQQQTDNGGANQRWRIEAMGTTGYYKLTAQHSGKALALDMNAATNGGFSDVTANGVRVFQYGTNAADNRLWKIEATSDGFYRLTNKRSSKALDIRGGATTDGAMAQQWGYINGTSQQWKLEKVTSTSAPSLAASASAAVRPSPGLLAFPNPSPAGRSTLALEAKAAQRVRVYVHNAQGTLVSIFSVACQPGRTDFRLPAGLAPGAYYLRATLDGAPQHFTLQVQ